MAVNPNDPAYKAEVVPDSIKRLGVRLRAAYNVGPDNFGERGNLAHTSGYHRSRRYNRVHVPGNYSIVLAADKLGDENWISAFDITPSVWGSSDNRQKMIFMTKRMRAAARARDSRVSALREFAGTEDGRKVVTVDMQTGADREPFDDSHLDHGHGSLFRGRAAEDHTGIYQVLTGDGDGMSESWSQPIPIGNEGFIGHSRDTGLVFAWEHAWYARQNSAQLLELVRAIAGKVDIDPAELAAIEASARAGTETALAAAADGIVTRVLAGISQGAQFNPQQLQQVEAALRDALSPGLVLAPAPDASPAS